MLTTLCEAGCRRHAGVLWWNDTTDREWQLCAVHSDMHAEALVIQEYALIHDDRVEEIHPRLAPLSTDPATH